MSTTSVQTRPGTRLRRLLAAGVTIGSVVAFTATAAHATNYDHEGERDDRARMAAPYTFRTINDPADPTFNQLLGINDHGRIVGYFASGMPGHPNRGYVVKGTPEHPQFRNENFPGSAQTQVVGINDDGTTVGFWVDGAGANAGFVLRDGMYTSVTNPATPATTPFNQLLGINRRGIAVGFYNDATGTSHGYTYDTLTGRFTPVVLPVAADSVTATGINAHGDISGFYVTGQITTGFVLRHGQLQQLSFGAKTNTQALGMNDADQVVGSYLDGAGAMHGFLWSHTRGLRTIDDPHATGGSLVNGLNNTGQLVGFYIDGAGNTDGFLAHR